MVWFSSLRYKFIFVLTYSDGHILHIIIYYISYFIFIIVFNSLRTNLAVGFDQVRKLKKPLLPGADRQSWVFDPVHFLAQGGFKMLALLQSMGIKCNLTQRKIHQT